MKCAACGYEYEQRYGGGMNGTEEIVVKGDDKFVRIGGHFTRPESSHGYCSALQEVQLYACPKCGTVRMED